MELKQHDLKWHSQYCSIGDTYDGYEIIATRNTVSEGY